MKLELLSRTLYKSGKKIVCFIEVWTNGIWVKSGKPSDATCISWKCGDYAEASALAERVFYRNVSYKTDQTLTIV